jgi:hypothetical protein
VTQTTKRSTAIVKHNQEGAALAAPSEFTVDELMDQMRKIQQAMKEAMKEGEHYGTIPGTQKPTLLKPGAEKLVFLFRLDPQYEVIESSENDRLVSYTVRAVIFHSPTGTRLASGMGQANSREAKYRYRWETVEERPDKKTAEALKLKGLGRWRKFSGQWVWQIRVENDNPMDQANTLLKMACKRALIAGVLNATAASDIFTQDLEDLGPGGPPPEAVSELTLTALHGAINIAADYEPKLWATEVVAKNAATRFHREITDLAQLSEIEALQILKGAEAWLDKSHPGWAEGEVVEAENVEAAEVEVVESEESTSGGD